jgi:hypothetical protein
VARHASKSLKDTVEASPEDGLPIQAADAAQAEVPQLPDSSQDIMDALLGSLTQPVKPSQEDSVLPPTGAAKAQVPEPPESVVDEVGAFPDPLSDRVEAPQEDDPSPMTGAAQAENLPSPDSPEDIVNAFPSPPSEPVEASEQDHKSPPTAGAPQAEVPRLTPDHRLTTEELRSLRKPGDTVITASGHKVEVLEDGEERLLLLSQPSVDTTTNVSSDPSMVTGDTDIGMLAEA